MTNTPQVPATAQALGELMSLLDDDCKDPVKWDGAMARAREALASEAQGARSAEAPFDLETLKEQAGAWLMVAQTLHEVAPWWTEGASNGRDSACSAIRRLATHPAHPQVAAVVPKAQAEAGVFLVATGEVHEGEETYTRHEGRPPPLCDFEGPLYRAPAPQEREAQAEAGGVPPLPSIIREALEFYVNNSEVSITFNKAHRASDLKRYRESPDWRECGEDGRGHEIFRVTERKAEQALDALNHWEDALSTPAPQAREPAVPRRPSDDEERTQPWYDLAWASGATGDTSFDGDELNALTFTPGEFEEFCEKLLATVETEKPTELLGTLPRGAKLYLGSQAEPAQPHPCSLSATRSGCEEKP